MSDVTVVPCEDSDCDSSHAFPEPGTWITVREAFTGREPGTDVEQYPVPAGALGRVVSYVPEWHDVEVMLTHLDGLRVWVDVDNLDIRKGST